MLFSGRKKRVRLPNLTRLNKIWVSGADSPPPLPSLQYGRNDHVVVIAGKERSWRLATTAADKTNSGVRDYCWHFAEISSDRL